MAKSRFVGETPHIRIKNKKRRMTLPVEEFLRRFLLHLLPKGLVRIRHFGFLANRRRATLLPVCFQLLGEAIETETAPEGSKVNPTLAGGPAPGVWTCPNCGGPMRIIERVTAAQIRLRSLPLQVP